MSRPLSDSIARYHIPDASNAEITQARVQNIRPYDLCYVFHKSVMQSAPEGLFNLNMDGNGNFLEPTFFCSTILRRRRSKAEASALSA